MRPCFQIEIETPKKVVLNGLWFGPLKASNVIVFVHGLTASAFSQLHTIDPLVTSDTAVITFNNRGYERVAEVKRIVGQNRKWIQAGAAHEVFADCVDDIQGAVDFARKQGAKFIFVAGHSTGCQKSIYWASKSKNTRNVKGIVLLAPVSDYAAETHLQGRAKIAKAEKVARSLVRRGKKHSLLPEGAWHETLDAQRFLSLYTPDSAEEIFPYAQPKKRPITLRKVRIPVLVLWAEGDEYGDRKPQEISEWFEHNLTMKHRVVIVPEVKHSFKGGEEVVAKEIREWMGAQK